MTISTLLSAFSTTTHPSSGDPHLVWDRGKAGREDSHIASILFAMNFHGINNHSIFLHIPLYRCSRTYIGNFKTFLMTQYWKWFSPCRFAAIILIFSRKLWLNLPDLRKGQQMWCKNVQKRKRDTKFTISKLYLFTTTFTIFLLIQWLFNSLVLLQKLCWNFFLNSQNC